MLAAEPPELTTTVDGLKEKEGECLGIGEIVAVSETVPSKPFTLVTVIVSVTEDRLFTVWTREAEPRVKVGVGNRVYVAPWTFSGTGWNVPLEKLTHMFVPFTLEGEQPVWYPILVLAEPVTL